MIRTLCAVMILALAGLIPTAAPAAAPADAATAAQAPAAAASGSALFIENAGQFDPAARFRVWGGRQAIWLAEDAIWLTAAERSDAGTLNGAAVKLSFPGAEPHARIVPFDRLGTRVSYFRGNDPSGWRADVPVWGGVRYVDLYPGVTLELAGGGEDVAWRLTARPGADLTKVRLRIEGADSVTVGGGRILLDTAAGTLGLAPEADFALPVEVSGAAGRTEMLTVPAVPASSAVSGVGSAPAGAPADNPADLLYSTFLGTGGGGNMCDAIAVDAAGRATVTGNTTDMAFPVTPGAFDTTFNGKQDVFVARLNAAGTALEYATFLGGEDWDAYVPRCAIAVDAQGRAYVAGETDSRDFPTTPGAFDTTFNGGHFGGDGFLARLNAAGTRLDYSTYLGGSGDDAIASIAIDGAGRAYVTGSTTSGDFPAGAGADTTFNGVEDGFAIRFDAAGARLEYATFLGGSASDAATAIALDSAGRAYVAGATASRDFPTTAAALDTSFNGGGSDAFLVRLNARGDVRDFSSFLGGTGADRNPALAVDAANRAYVLLSTASRDMAVSPGAPGPALAGNYDCYAARLGPAGNVLDYGTYLGGSGTDCYFDTAIAVDRYGRALLAGNTVDTSAADFPTTADAFDRTFNGGWDDAFVALLSLDGTRLEYSTFFGGSDDETVNRVAPDASGNAYVVGYSTSKDFPASAGAFDTTFSGEPYQDHFVAKLHVGKTIPPATATPTATAVPSRTATATTSPTRTRTRTPAATATSRATPSRTATPTRTATTIPVRTPSATSSPPSCLSAIRGYVWLDLDGNGTLDEREPPIPGITVRLDGPTGLQQTETSVHSGLEYRFEDLPPGSYTVTAIRPAWIRFASTPDEVAVSLADCRVRWVSFGVWVGGATFLPLVRR